MTPLKTLATLMIHLFLIYLDTHFLIGYSVNVNVNVNVGIYITTNGFITMIKFSYTTVGTL